MHVSTPFQLLPPHIVQRIVHYVVRSSRMLADWVLPDSEEYRALLRPLLWTCHNFRAVAYLQLEIVTNEGTTYSGEALDMLSHPPYDGCSFPNVRKLVLDLTTNGVRHDRMASSPRDMANIIAFVQRVKEMAPKVRHIRVIPYSAFHCDSISPNFNCLVSQLFGHATCVEYGKFRNNAVPVRLQLSDIRNLVYIKYTAVIDAGQFIHLARLNAPTLQSLPDTAQSASRDIVLFPRLQYLHLEGDYLFGDDVLFRGNEASLRSLDIGFHKSGVEMLCKYNVFTPTSHPKLEYVRVKFWREMYTAAAKNFRPELGIGLKAPVRMLNGDFLAADIAPALLSVGNFAYIHVLMLQHVSLDHWAAFAIIKSLPLLSVLHADFPRLGKIPPDVALDDLSADVISTYAPMGKRFRCWKAGRCGFGRETETAKFLLMLALVCPNFTYSVSPSDVRKELKRVLKDTIALGTFKDYAPRLQHLLFNGWGNC
ncbi:hypothetical protein IW146_005448 [Coemansia sp. RSA 922]|nr:hypothetical protein IW146_005448 [Coemansia sp. RSA 922]